MTLLTMTLLTMTLLVLPAGAGARDGRSGVQLRLVLPCTFYVLTVHLLFTYCLLTMYSLASATRSPSSRTSSLSWVAAAAAETTAAASSAASAARQHGQSAPSAAHQLGPCASSGRAWRLWLAGRSEGWEPRTLGAQPLPRVLELAASKAASKGPSKAANVFHLLWPCRQELRALCHPAG